MNTLRTGLLMVTLITAGCGGGEIDTSPRSAVPDPSNTSIHPYANEDGEDPQNTSIGACTVPGDWSQLDSDQELEKARDITTSCLLSCISHVDVEGCTRSCVEAQTSLSSGCVGCFTASGVCGITNCLAQCAADPSSEGCSVCLEDKGCIADFFTCSGLQDSPPPPPVGACTGPGDWSQLDSDHELENAREMTTSCLLSCISHADVEGCTRSCVEAQTSLSSGCVGCFTASGVCGITNCLAQCAADPSSEGCSVCLEDSGCIADFFTCSGLPY